MRSGCLPDTQINNLASICITVNDDCLKPQYHTVDSKNMAEYVTYIIIQLDKSNPWYCSNRLFIEGFVPRHLSNKFNAERNIYW